MNVKFYAATFFLVAGGAAIGSYIVPRGGELAMIYYKSGRFAEAQRILEAELRGPDLDPSNVHYAMQTYLRIGEPDKAAAIVERYVDETQREILQQATPGARIDPDRIDPRRIGYELREGVLRNADRDELAGLIAARRVLGRIYRDTGKLTLYAKNLEFLEAMIPAREQRRELARVYAMLGQHENWHAMLERLVEDGQATAAEHVAVAQRLASEKRYDRALAVLDSLDRTDRAGHTIQVYDLAVSLELDAGRKDRALARAESGYARFAGWRAAISFADLFQRRGQRDLALRILEKAEAEAAAQPALLRHLVLLELDQGRATRALARLKALERDGKLAEGSRDLLLLAALRAGDWETARAAFARIEPELLSESAIASFAQEAASRGDKDAVAQALQRLGDELLERMPVLAAQLSLTIEDRPAALRWAAAAERKTDLPLQDRIGLSAVLLRLGEAQRAAAILRQIGAQGDVPDFLLMQLAVQFVKLDLLADGQAMFAELRRRRPDSLWIRAAAALIARKSGRGETDIAWVAAVDAAAAPEGFLATVYFVAMDAQDFAMATAFARKLVAASDTPDNALRLARALTMAGEAGEAMTLAKPLIGKHEEARAVYAQALIRAAAQGKANPGETQEFLTAQLNDPAVPAAQKRQLVYDLIAFKAVAIVLPVLERLAEARADEFVDLYLEALIEAKEKARFQAALRSLIARLPAGPALRKVAKYAFQEAQTELARQAYAKLLQADRRDREALKHLGLIAFYQSNNELARRYLEEFVALGGDDYLADYTLGEVITSFPDWQRATPHFQRAFDKLNRMQDAKLEDRKIRARLLYRLGRFDEARQAYEALLRQYPRDQDLRNQYSDFLAEIGRYDDAQRVRGGRR